MRRALAGLARWISGATPQSRLALIAAGCTGLAVIPAQALDRLPDLCLWERLFGYCPAHGTVHALAMLLHGDLASAVAYNPNVLLIAPLLTALVATDVARLVRRRTQRAVGSSLPHPVQRERCQPFGEGASTGRVACQLSHGAIRSSNPHRW